MKNIIIPGSFLEKKDLKTIIDAANLMKNKDLIFKIYDYDSNSNQIKNEIENLSLKNVKFEEIVSKEDLKKAYNDGDLFIYSDNHAGDSILPMLLEAIAYGIPIISMNPHMPSEFIKDNQSGFIIDSNDSKSLVNKIKEVNKISADKLFSIVRNAQNSILNISDVEKTMNTLLSIWNNDKLGIFLLTNKTEDEELEKISDILDKIYHYTTSPFDLLVVDNNSDVKFKEFLKKYSSKKENMKVILLNTNIFTGSASNIALNELNNEFVICLCGNEDYTLKLGWELDALDLMKNNPHVGIAGNLISCPSLFNEDSFKSTKWFENARNQYLIKNEYNIFKYVDGNCFILRKKVFDELGGFNPKLAQQYWDIEYSYYIESEGWGLKQIPDWI